MRTDRHLHKPLSAAEFASVMDEAKRRAAVLRAEAVDAFWSAVARSIRGAGTALRSNLRKHLIHHHHREA